MNEVINSIVDFSKSIPLYIWGIGGVVLILLIAILIVIIRKSRLIHLALKNMDSGKADSAITAKLLNNPSLVEILIKRRGDDVISFFGIAEHLVRRMEKRKKPEDVRRLLELAPEEGLYPVFRLALQKDSIARIFKDWVKENRNVMLLRKMALDAGGDKFDGKKVRELLNDCLDDLRELSGDPQWQVRYFALRVMLFDDDSKTIRLLKESFQDPHPLLRRTAAENVGNDNLDELFDALKIMVLDDPVPEVRQSARKRIDTSFPERWKLDPAEMDDLQTIHVLELLKQDSKEDENTAITALESESLETRLAAARFLEKSGALDRLFLGANRGDREDWNRRFYLLSKSVSVGISGFLEKIKTTDIVDVLLLGAKILSEGGDNSLITNLAESTFNRKEPIRDADEEELYHTAVSLACMKGDSRARSLIRDELRKRRKDTDVLSFILPLLPPAEAPVFKDVLLDFLKDDNFAAEEAFLDILSKIPPSMFLGTVLEILEKDRSFHSHKVRLRALKCLGVWHLDYTLQTILENLPILPMEMATEFASHMSKMNSDVLRERAGFILASPDAGIRAALIAILPAAGINTYIKEIREGLNDADPDVRIACLRALFDFGELKATGPALTLLRDPVEHVRLEAARIAGMRGSEKFLEILEEIIKDQNEADSVRIAAMEGLALSNNTASVSTMVSCLDIEESLHKELIAAMAKKTDKKSIVALVENFKDSEAVIRDKISEVFTAMGEKGEAALVSLLKEDIASLKPFLADILTRTGFIEILIRKLSHRKPAVRKEAADLLAQIATDSAFRGIVLAARDPDRDVRIMVTKALETLATPAGENILKSLQEDPDRKVRKYTHWAMERLKAKKLP